MDFIVEDGTGENPQATSYVSVQRANEITELYGLEWPEGAFKEQALASATDYLDANLKPVGRILNKEQPLNFPRHPFRDVQGREIEGVPFEIEKATVFLALEHVTDSLFEDRATLRSQRFGDSAETYAGTYTESQSKNYILRRLVALGYGRKGSAVVNLERA